jgi:UPF0042 nucleotide-binding protein
MRLIVVSGLSGAGKSVALHTLEDLGFYCTDNLPASLLPEFARQMAAAAGGGERAAPALPFEQVAVGIDARNPEPVLRQFPGLLAELTAQGARIELVFLDAEDAILIKRFSETRRRHPLSLGDVPLEEAIRRERYLLESLADQATIRIDTSHTTLHQLRDIVRERIGQRARDALSLLVQSFGFKHGVPKDADFVFDVRCLPNPHWDPQLRPYTGRDAPVAEYLASEPAVERMFATLAGFLDTWVPEFQAENRAYLTVALGCTGGQHRSVYLAERLAAHFQERPSLTVQIRHRELRA